MKSTLALILYGVLYAVFTLTLATSACAEAKTPQPDPTTRNTAISPQSGGGIESTQPGSSSAVNITQVEKIGASVLSRADDKEYVCPPCGHACLETKFKEGGSCGECGMALVVFTEELVARTRAAANQPRKKVAILLFDGVQIIDYTGPWEVFGSARYNVYTVAKKDNPITTAYGMKVIPSYTLENSPQPDIILVPGGGVFATQNDAQVQAWLRSKSEHAEVVLSVCNGAFILAKSGLLNGLKATTTRALVDGLAEAAPNITIVHNTRWVDNGKVITSGGLSAGIDAALHVVARFEGKERAERLAWGLEYEWRQNPTQAGK